MAPPFLKVEKKLNVVRMKIKKVHVLKMLSAKTIRMIYGGVVEMLGDKYGFNVEEALSVLLEDVGRGVGRGVGKGVEKKSKCKKIPLPFISIDYSKCKGCKMNRGLYTQCENAGETENELCNECSKECDDNNGILPYGRIEQRAAQGDEFKDSKGRSPTPYIKVLEKLKISIEEAENYAKSIGIELPSGIFEMPAKKVKEIRGRPKKASKSVEVDSSENLFEGLVQISLSETVSDDENSESLNEAEKEAEKLAKEAEKLAKEAEKQAKKEALEAEKLAKKEALEAEKLAKKEALEAEKLAKEAEKQAKKEALEAEKLAKKEALEAEKLAKKEALEAEKLAKKEALEAEKQAKEAEKKAKKEPKKESKKESKKETKKETKKGNVTPCVSDSEEEEEQEEVSCKKFEFNGKTYLKTAKNVLYDFESQDEIGVWNEKEQKIEYCELSEDEEEE